jgi:hypothetical protein
VVFIIVVSWFGRVMAFPLSVVFGFITKPLTMIRLFAELFGHYLVSGKTRPLPRETCAASSRLFEQPADTATGNRVGERAGVSRSRGSAGNEPGVSAGPPQDPPKAPEGLTHARRTELIGTAETAGCFQLEMALDAGSSHERSQAAEKDRSRKGEQWERVLSPENINAAWRQVRQNAGAPGIDAMSIAAFPAFTRTHWTKVRAKLQDGTYSPSPVRRIAIPKKTGGERPLGIPTVLDRVIQQALAQELSGVFEETFSNHSPSTSLWALSLSNGSRLPN